MNTNLVNRAWRRGAFALAAAGCLLLGGCLEQCVVWAPDGERAAVLIDGGLRMCGPDGKLTEVLVPGVCRVAWLGDSQQLVLARTHSENAWPPIARALGSERAAGLVAKGESIWQKLQTGSSWDQARPLFGEKEFNLLRIYLRERYGDALRAKLDAGRWDQCVKQTADVCALLMARRDGERIVPGTQLFEGLGSVKDIRVSPGDRAVAFTVETPFENQDRLQLMVVQTDTSTPALVADRVAVTPSWTADGRSLVYAQASGLPTGKDDLLLGVVAQRRVLDEAGRIKLDAESKPLAGVIFNDDSHVHCLRDGRVLFTAIEISLPISAEDFDGRRQQLFAIDPARQATLVRLIPRKHEAELPESLAFFDVSPDEQQVAFGSYRGQVSVLTLATGEVQKLQGDVERDGIQGAPVWRKDGALTYTRRAEVKGGKKPLRGVEVVVRRGDKEQVLSVTWPDELVNKLFSKDAGT